MRKPRVRTPDNGAPDPVRAAFVTTVHLLEAGRASLLLRRNSEPVLTVAAALGIPPSRIPEIHVHIGEGISGEVARRGRPLCGTISGETYLSLPVMTDRGVEGVLNLTCRMGGKPYTEDDIPQAEAMAQLLGHLLQYSRRAATDPVSGVLNRQTFDEMLERELIRSQRSGGPFAVIFMDLDGLKQMNDELGHAAGDRVIGSLGQALQRVVRPGDCAGRYGGDEFVLLLSDCREADESIRARINEAVAHATRELPGRVAVSIGTARYPEDGNSAKDLVAIADARMYQQKHARKNAPLAGYTPKPSSVSHTIPAGAQWRRGFDSVLHGCVTALETLAQGTAFGPPSRLDSAPTAPAVPLLNAERRGSDVA